MNHYIEISFWILNLLTFLVYGYDKRKAQNHQWRVSEKMLIGLAIVGGSVGAFLGMKFFHHKTQKSLFKVGVPVILILQVSALIYLSQL